MIANFKVDHQRTTVGGTIVLQWENSYISAANGVTACGNISEGYLGSWLGVKTFRQVVAQILGGWW
jgi:hypothetical protein